MKARTITSRALRLSLIVSIAAVFLFALSSAQAVSFSSSWSGDIERAWAGPDYWANRLQDWKIKNGMLVNVEGRAGKPMRTVHLLTRSLGEIRGNLDMSVTIVIAGAADTVSPDAAAGFLIGAGSELDYRGAALVHHSPGPGGGLFAGIDMTGRLFIKDFGDPVAKKTEDQTIHSAREIAFSSKKTGTVTHINISLSVTPSLGYYSMTLKSFDPATGTELDSVETHYIPPSRMIGNLALVAHPGSGKANGTFMFGGWNVSGSKVEAHDNRNCGPILSTQYTLHDYILKMTAQMMPIGELDNQAVRLEILRDGEWKKAAETKVIVPGFTAPFRVENWNSGTDTPYRVVYALKQADGSDRLYYHHGTIRRDPIDKETIVLAGFTGNHNVRRGGAERAPFDWNAEGVWFPHNDIVDHVTKQGPDFLFFSGDQVYEGASPTGKDRQKPYLDYLYKWYLWCWAYRDLTSDIPAVTEPDDHDVFHGNVWGAGGRHAEAQDDGGYTMPADWVRMVERTQTSHLPDPYDPTPIEQGIGVYYTAVNYGGISFAVIEDRKFKSSPTVMLPKGKVINGWAKNPDFDHKTEADVPGAVLLGDRQLKFLDDWAADWSDGVWMKTVLSQTLFANVATLPTPANTDGVVPGLKRVTASEYPPNDLPVADGDSNGWPQTGRNKAVRAIRRAFAFHLCGDQHLGSTIRYGVDDWKDAGFALCVPSVANFFPRRWYPKTPGQNRAPGSPRYAGDFIDGFGNHITVHAVSNPVVTGRHPILLHDKAPGYGIVRFEKSSRKITIECWPRWADPTSSDAEQYPGWPVVAHQEDNYGRKAAAWLPTIKVSGMRNPVVQVIDEADGEIVYTLRINGTSWRPKVFRDGTYTVKVGEPGTAKMKTLTGVKSKSKSNETVVEVKL